MPGKHARLCSVSYCDISQIWGSLMVLLVVVDAVTAGMQLLWGVDDFICSHGTPSQPGGQPRYRIQSIHLDACAHVLGLLHCLLMLLGLNALTLYMKGASRLTALAPTGLR